MNVSSERLAQQIRFVIEIDKLKHVLRRTYLLDQSRRENDAEHSWHLAVMTILLHEYAETPVDLLRVLKMVLIHDIVEIDAGDAALYDEAGNADKAERELAAADRLFSLLPRDQAEEIRDLWQEFEARITPEARFARALDRVQPILHNYHTGGTTWRELGVTAKQVLAKNRDVVFDGSPALGEYVVGLIADAVAKGYLPPG
jgi:putative hydrolase of HD superfamily